MKYIPVIILLFISVVFTNADASRIVSDNLVSRAKPTICEKVSINVSVNGNAQDIKTVQDDVNKIAKRVFEFANKLGVEKPILQSENFNINNNIRSYNNPGYSYNANASFKLTANHKQAAEMLAMFTKENIQASFNLNKYSRYGGGACQ